MLLTRVQRPLHITLESAIKVHDPNILSELNKVILDFELEYQRLEQGLEITRKPETNIGNAARRNACKEHSKKEHIQLVITSLLSH